MDEWLAVFAMIVAMIQGIIIGYLIWAPSSPFKEGFMNGLTFGLAWKKKKFKYAPLWTSSKRPIDADDKLLDQTVSHDPLWTGSEIRLKDGGELRDQTPPPAHNSMWTGSEIRRENVEKNK